MLFHNSENSFPSAATFDTAGPEELTRQRTTTPEARLAECVRELSAASQSADQTGKAFIDSTDADLANYVLESYVEDFFENTPAADEEQVLYILAQGEQWAESRLETLRGQQEGVLLIMDKPETSAQRLEAIQQNAEILVERALIFKAQELKKGLLKISPEVFS